jgi:hypothetical protein
MKATTRPSEKRKEKRRIKPKRIRRRTKRNKGSRHTHTYIHTHTLTHIFTHAHAHTVHVCACEYELKKNWKKFQKTKKMKSKFEIVCGAAHRFLWFLTDTNVGFVIKERWDQTIVVVFCLRHPSPTFAKLQFCGPYGRKGDLNLRSNRLRDVPAHAHDEGVRRYPVYYFVLCIMQGDRDTTTSFPTRSSQAKVDQPNEPKS